MGNTGVFSIIQEYLRYEKYRGIFNNTRIHEIWEIQGYFQEYKNTFDMGNTGVFSRIQEYIRYGKYRGIFKNKRIHEIWEIQGYFQEYKNT